MVERQNALAHRVRPGILGQAPLGSAEVGIVLRLLPAPQIVQLAAWPDSLAQVAAVVAARAGAAPLPGRASFGPGADALRVEPLKWWLLNDTEDPPVLDPHVGSVLDLSHSRVALRISGARVFDLLVRMMPIDVRPMAFPVGACVTHGFHHVAILVIHRPEGVDLLLPRAFAESLWEALIDIALQFGVEVV